jgi:hypothetical protein
VRSGLNDEVLEQRERMEQTITEAIEKQPDVRLADRSHAIRN